MSTDCNCKFTKLYLIQTLNVTIALTRFDMPFVIYLMLYSDQPRERSKVHEVQYTHSNQSDKEVTLNWFP